MKVIRTEAEWKPIWTAIFKEDKSLGFVPTMGALHQGHLDLVAKSTAAMDFTVVSIFVNPTQFNSSEDFQKYPQTLEADLAQLDAAGADYVFVPSVTTLYPQPTRTRRGVSPRTFQWGRPRGIQTLSPHPTYLRILWTKRLAAGSHHQAPSPGSFLWAQH